MTNDDQREMIARAISGAAPDMWLEQHIYAAADRVLVALSSAEPGMVAVNRDAVEAAYAALTVCPEGCGCRFGTNDADRVDCGCLGPCTMDDTCAGLARAHCHQGCPDCAPFWTYEDLESQRAWDLLVLDRRAAACGSTAGSTSEHPDDD